MHNYYCNDYDTNRMVVFTERFVQNICCIMLYDHHIDLNNGFKKLTAIRLNFIIFFIIFGG